MLDSLKMLLGIVDNTQNDKLILILDSVVARLKILLGGKPIDNELEHIVIEVAIIRFNRLGSEGMSSHTVEGEGIKYQINDFDPYMDEIAAWLKQQEDTKIGKVRFI